MAAQIVVDQAAKPPGIAGKAREDLDTGTDITVAAAGGPFLQHLWRIVDRPIDIVGGAESTSVLATATASSSVITPVDVAGSYLVELLVDSGQGLGAGADDIARITFYAGPALAASPTSLPRRRPAARETLEHNVDDAIFPSGNPRGWAQEWERWFAIIEGLSARNVIPVHGVAGRQTNDNNTLTAIGGLVLPLGAVPGGYPAAGRTLTLEVLISTTDVTNTTRLDFFNLTTSSVVGSELVSASLTPARVTLDVTGEVGTSLLEDTVNIIQVRLAQTTTDGAQLALADFARVQVDYP